MESRKEWWYMPVMPAPGEKPGNREFRALRLHSQLEPSWAIGAPKPKNTLKKREGGWGDDSAV